MKGKGQEPGAAAETSVPLHKAGLILTRAHAEIKPPLPRYRQVTADLTPSLHLLFLIIPGIILQPSLHLFLSNMGA